MRRILFGLVTLLLLGPPVASAQVIEVKNITTQSGGTCVQSGATPTCARFKIQSGSPSVTIQLSGTFTGTFSFEATSQADQETATYEPIALIAMADGSTATSATAVGQFALANTGVVWLQVRATAAVTGTAVVTATKGGSRPLTAGGSPGAGDIEGVTAGAGMTGGGASGTVTLNVIAGTGITVNANDVQVSAAILGGGYWTSGAVADLSGEVSLAGFTGLVLNTAGTPSAYAGGSCTNQFARSLNGSGAVTCASVNSTDMAITGSITFPDDVRQTFNPGATVAGLSVGSQAGDPSTPANGDLWYDSTGNALKARINGATVSLGAGGGAPTDATYWVGAANGTLSAEINLGALSTALVINTAGTPSAYAGASCTNQFVRSLSAVGAATCASIVNADVDASAAIALSKLATQAANTVVANVTDGSAVPTAVTYDTLATEMGIASMATAPGADAIAFYDFSDSEIDWLNTATQFTISGNTLTLSTTLSLSGNTSFTIPVAAAPTIDAVGKIAIDNDFYAASHGALTYHDGTAQLNLCGASNTPANGQFIRWNTGGGCTWETPGGSGTVTATGGALTANAVVLGAGTTDTKVVAGITSDGTSKLNLGVAGASVGGVLFANATSGTVEVRPVTGALGTVVASLQAVTGTIYVTGGTDVAVADGGTGASTLTGLVQGNGTSAFTTVTDSTTVGQVLRVTGSNTYGWGAVNLADSDAITGTLPAANGPPIRMVYNLAVCTGASASIAVGLFTADPPTAECFGTNVRDARLIFPDTAALTEIQGSFILPSTFSAITANLIWSSTGTGNAVPQFWVACTSSDDAPNDTWVSTTATTSAQLTAGDDVLYTLTLTTTGCVGNDRMNWRLGRENDHASDTLNATFRPSHLFFEIVR